MLLRQINFMLTLLVGVLAATHDDHGESATTRNSHRLSGATKTLVLTVTRVKNSTMYQPAITRSGFATPPPPGSVSATDIEAPALSSNQTLTKPTLTCPAPTNGCVVSSVFVWPTRNGSVSVPHSTVPPLPTSMITTTAPFHNTTLMAATTSGSPINTKSTMVSDTRSDGLTRLPTTSSTNMVSMHSICSRLSKSSRLSQPSATVPRIAVVKNFVQARTVTSMRPAWQTQSLELLDPAAWVDVDNDTEGSKIEEGKATKR